MSHPKDPKNAAPLPLEDDDGMKDFDPENNDDKIVRKSSNGEKSGPDCDD